MWIVFLYFPVAALVYGIALVIYRLTLHPLARIPGPKFSAATKWWEFYVDVVRGGGGGFMYEIDRMHEKYGPIVRINPHEIHISDPTWLDKLYPGPGPRRDKYAPAAHISGVPYGTFGTIDHYIHRQRRSAVKTFVSKRSVRTFQSGIQHVVEDLCTCMSQYANTQQVFDASLPYIAWSTDSVTNYLEDKPYGLLKDEEAAKNWKATIKTVVELTPVVKQIPAMMLFVLRVPEWAMRRVSKDLNRVLVMHKGMQSSATRAHTAYQRAEKQEQPEASTNPLQSDAYQAILYSSLPEPEKQPARLAQEILTMLVGGSATTAKVMTRTTYHLTSEPAMLARLREELKTIMPDPFVTPAMEQLEQLSYLTAIIKESLRITTALRSRLPLISPDKPLVYKNWVIPAGTPTSMTPASILTDPAIYTDPSTFNPDRWLGPAESVAKLDKYFVPFGRGARMCIGMNFAWAELYICTATLFRRFDFQICDVDRARDVDVVRDCFLGEPSLGSKGVRVRVREFRSEDSTGENGD